MLKRGPTIACGFLATVGVTAAGCGGPPKFENKPRPPAPVQLTGVIRDDKVTVSPNRVGAGPIILLISNQTKQSRRLILDIPGTLGTKDDPQIGPINPLDTGKLQEDLNQGTYMIRAGSDTAVRRQIQPATLTVGPKRRDSSNEVLLP